MTAYELCRALHITTALGSLALFAARWLAGLSGAAWPQRRSLALFSHSLDSVLLASALTLAVLTGQNPAVQPWLAAKLTAVVVYILLGALALKRAPTRAGRGLAGLAALLVATYIVSVAVSRQPWLGGN